METFSSQDALSQAIRQRFGDLSRRLKQVAEYVLEQPSAIAFGTTASIAAEAGVHPSALIRFANAFGFTGFSEMQALFRERLMETSSGYQTRIQSLRERGSSGDRDVSASFLEEICNANVQAMNRLVAQVDLGQLAEAKKLLAAADLIHVQGAGRSFPAAAYGVYLLGNVGRKPNLIEESGALVKSRMQLMELGGALLAISFAPYAEDTLAVVGRAVELGLPVVGITDSTVSPLASIADVTLQVREAEVHSFRSLNVTMNLLQALILGLAADPGGLCAENS